MAGAEKKAYFCDSCEKVFTSKPSLESHIICMHKCENRPYRCSECKKGFLSEISLRAHEFKIHFSVLSKCQICRKSIHNLRRHMQLMHSGTKHQCNICGEIKASKRFLTNHMNKIHPDWRKDASGSKDTACDYCKKMFCSKRELRYHILRIHRKGSHKCKQCGRTYACEQYLKAHQTNMHTTKKCNICGKILKPRSVKGHLLNVHCYQIKDAENSTYTCDYCQKVFTNKSTIVFHIRSVHRDKSYKCDECGILVAEEKYLTAHKINMHAVTKSNIYDDFLRPRTLKSDMDTKYDDQRIDLGSGKYTCDYCKKRFPSKVEIICHISVVHLKRSYECDQCGSTYAREEHLKAHQVKMHIPVECDICGVSMYPLSLKGHMLIAHHDQVKDAERSLYTCDYCQKMFLTKLDVTKHITCVHANGSYKCDVCGIPFVCKKTLTTHKKNRHFIMENNIYDDLLRPRISNSDMNTKHDGRPIESKQQSTCNKSEKENSGTSTIPVVDKSNAMDNKSSSQNKVIDIKEELIAEVLEIGPVVLQHMDFNYRPLKEEPLID